MKRLLAHIGLAGCLGVLLLCPAWGQGQQGSSSGGGNQPSAGGGSNRGNTNQPSPRTQPNPANQVPMYVEGQVINDEGKVPDDSVSVVLNCGFRALQTVRTDIRGYFRFTLGMGTQANTDFSAANGAPPSSMMMGGGDFSTDGYSGMGTPNGGLTGCDIRISTPGYVPIDIPITGPDSLGTIDVGVLELRRIGTAPAGSVSVTSLMVPNKARKEYEQGLKDLRSNHVPQATEHLERAVKAYDKYAAAWTELGEVYAAGKEMQKAQQAYQKAIAVDPKFAPPYVGLGAVQLNAKDYQGALESVSKAVEINPAITVGVAGYIQGVADYLLNRPDEAQESLLQAEKGPHMAFPQLHVILADLYMQRQDSSSAATHMRAYLKEAPEGPFAAQMHTQLSQIEQSASQNASGTNAAPAVAP
jgi:hypothetical protein